MDGKWDPQVGNFGKGLAPPILWLGERGDLVMVMMIKYLLSKFPKDIYWTIMGCEKKCCQTNAK